MNYQLPSYPTNRLEALLHLDMLASAMIDQQPSSHHDYIIKGAIIPLGPIIHTGSMTMTILKMISQAQAHHYTLVYDPAMMTTDHTLSLSDTHKLTTSFGHQIKIESSITQIPNRVLVPDAIPQRVNELCCMLQIYDKIKSIQLYTITERETIDTSYPILRVGANLHQGLSLEASLVEDEKILTQLTLGQLNDGSLIGYKLLSTMIRYYELQSGDHSISPVSYHNTALMDGQKDATTGYCAAVII